jgi:opacity protein-like surface antigen
MRKALWCSLPAFLLMLCVPVTAQDFPKYEFSAGYSYSRMDRANWGGWHIDGVRNIGANLGIVLDFSAPRKSDFVENSGGFSYEQKQNVYAIMAGPRVAPRGDYRLIPFAHLLLGAAVNKYHYQETLGDTSFVYDDTSTQFAMGIGGGIDYKWKDRISFRGQMDYIGFRAAGNELQPAYWQKGIRLSVGIAVRFGSTQ